MLCEDTSCGTGPGCSPQSYTVNSTTIGGSATVTPGTLFYSSGPTPLVYPISGTTYWAVLDPAVHYSAQSQAYWLLERPVSGTAQLFTWHNNNTGFPVNGAIVVHNPNSFQVTMTIYNVGVKTGFGGGVQMWYDYFTSPQATVTIASGATVIIDSLSVTNVPNTYPWGLVALVNFSGPSGAASVAVYDVAYFDSTANLPSAKLAPNDATTGKRGLGSGYSTPIQASIHVANSAVPVNPSLITQYTCMTDLDSFSGDDVPVVTDPDGGQSKLQGCYGCIQPVVLTVYNDDAVYSHNIIISGGNPANTQGAKLAFNFNVPGGCSATELSQYEYLNLISDTLTPGGHGVYNFSFMDAAGYDAPLAVGVTVTS